MGAYDINTDYGDFHFTDGFVPVGTNWILEDNVIVTSNNVLLNTFYTFVFTVVDVNTSGVVNKRLIRVTSESTGETGNLSLSLPSDIISTDEVILPNFDLEVVFDEHEYYTPVPDINLSLSVDTRIIEAGEVATITGLLADSTSAPVENVRLPLNVGGTTVTVSTDNNGEFNYVYTGTGTRGKVLVSALGESVFFYDGTSDYVTAVVIGNSITFGRGLRTTGGVIVDWGDGSTDIINNPDTPVTHTYSDGVSSHDIIFDGVVTSLGDSCFDGCTGLFAITIPSSVTSLGNDCFYGCSGLTSVTIPNSITSLGIRCFHGCSSLNSIVIPTSITILYDYCFYGCSSLNSIVLPTSITRINSNCFRGCTGLISVNIPDSVTSIESSCFRDCSSLTSIVIPSSVISIGNNCFRGCSSLIDYDLYWETSPIQYSPNTMPANINTVFTVPYATTSIYDNAGYPLNKIVERAGTPTDLTITADKSVIQKTETATITALLRYNGLPVYNQSLGYVVKHDSTVLDSGSVTTDINGQATIIYTGTGVGNVIFEVEYDSSLEESYEIIDAVFYDPAISAPAENTWIVNGFTSSYSSSTGTLTSESFATCFANLKNTGVNPFDWDRPCCIEFDITNLNSNNADFQIYDNNNNCTRSFGALGITGNNDHVKILVGSNKIRYFINDVEQTNLTYDISISTFRCGLRATGTLSFKNFVIYPITDLVLSCSTPIIETGDNASIIASLTHAGGAYSGETLTYTVKHDNTVLDSGSDTTDTNGEVEIQYTGTGVGEVSIEVKYGENLMKKYNITDCILYDNMLSNTVSNYIFSTNQGNSLVSQSDSFLFTAGSSARYFQRQYNNAASLIGKTIRFELTGIPSNQWRLGIFAYVDGTYTNIIGDYTTDSGALYLDYSFDDENTEHALFRTYVNATAHTLKCKDFKIYPA